MTLIMQNRLVVLALGLVIGTIVGLNLHGSWPTVPLHATATHGQENFAIATGPVDSDVEAIYFLDFLTGDLKAAVMYPRLGKFNAFYSGNVVTDFGGAQNKNPKYLMVTGQINIPRGRANFQYANSIVYIAEATTGQIASYTIPWNAAKAAQNAPQSGNFVMLDKKPFRTAIIRD
jgi:hypothetical protein